MIDIHMPRLSDTMEEGAIAAWRKKPGDSIAIGDILVEIETDKATMEYEAYDAGVLHDILVPEGEVATIGMVIAHLDDGSPHTPAARLEDTSVRKPRDGQRPRAVGAVGTADSATSPSAAEGPQTPPDGRSLPAASRVIATPLVRRLARENSLDLGQVAGTGPGGRIIRADIDDALRSQASTPGAPDTPTAEAHLHTAHASASLDPRGSTVVPFDRTREVISRRLSESSSTTPHFSVTAVADVEDLLSLRSDINARRESSDRVKISVNDLLIRACAIALREHPQVNASYSPQGQGATLLHENVNIGIAVAASSGLVVPVIADADQKSASHIASESRRLTERAKARKITPADMTGGTFTISNLGMYGVEQFTAIINQPEGAILAVGAARPEAVVTDGSIEVRHRMRYTLSADHRIIDGALAARFLASLTDLLEHPLNIVV